MNLCFYRDANKREIDFVVTKNNRALFAVECKTGEGAISESIKHLAKHLPIPQYYQVHLGTKDVEATFHKTRILPFPELVKILRV